MGKMAYTFYLSYLFLAIISILWKYSSTFFKTIRSMAHKSTFVHFSWKSYCGRNRSVFEGSKCPAEFKKNTKLVDCYFSFYLVPFCSCSCVLFRSKWFDMNFSIVTTYTFNMHCGCAIWNRKERINNSVAIKLMSTLWFSIKLKHCSYSYNIQQPNNTLACQC